MAGETWLTIIGNLTADPELRFTQSGAAVVSYTVASTPRRYDKDSNEWKDGEATFMRCTTWRQAAENIAETLTKGMRVIVYGQLQQRSFETKEGDKRTVIELQNCEVGPSLQFASGKINRTQAARTNSGTATGDDPWGSPPNDPWGSSGGSGSDAGQQQGFADEPPFFRAPERGLAV